jgi:hypothetical protein
MAVHVVGEGQRFLTSGMDNGVRLWDLATGKELRRFEAPWSGLGLLAVSGDGRTLAVRGKENNVVLMELDTGKEMGKLGRHDEWVSGAAFSPDGRALITWCNDHTAHIWDVKSAHELRKFEFEDVRPQPGAGQPVPPVPVGPGGSRTGLGYAAAVSPDGRLIAYGSQAQYLAIQEVLTGKTLRVIDRLQPDGAGGFAFSPDGRVLAWSGWRQPAIHLLELATGRERHRFDGHKGRVTSLAFSADGRMIISGSEDTTALVWDLIGKFPQKGSPALDAAWRDLTENDAARAYVSMRRLVASPAEAIPYLRKHLQAVPIVDERRLARLIADLDSNQFGVREKAAKDLEGFGEVAVGACRKALQGQPSAEVRRRLESLIVKQDSEAWNPSPKRLRSMRAVEVLEMAGTPEAQELLKSLAKGEPEAQLTREARASLNRLAR